MTEYSEREKEEDILFLDTAHDWNHNWPDDEIKTIVGIVASHIKIGHFNAEFKDREEMLSEIQEQIDFRNQRISLPNEKGGPNDV